MKHVNKVFKVMLTALLAVGLCSFVATNALADDTDLTVGTFEPQISTTSDSGNVVPGDKLNGVKVRFRPAGSYKPVSVEDNGDGSQKDLILYYLGESSHFRLEQAGEDCYTIRFFNDFANQDVKRSGAQILDVERNDNDNSTYYRVGQNIHMVSGTEDAPNKRWRLIQQSDGTYYIQNVRSNLYWTLKDVDEPKTNNNEIIQSDKPMKWEIELVSTQDFNVDSMKSIKQYDSLNFSCGGNTVTSLNWMSFLPDNMPLSDVSIPGTHDAATARIDTSDKESRRTQQYYMDEMLMAGVRHFDTRLGWEHNEITLVHSDDADALNHEGSDLTLETVLGWMTSFLQANPSEALIMQIMADENEAKVEAEALQYLGAIAKQPNSIIWSGDHVPTLQEARGKIVIISRFNKTDASKRDFSMDDGTFWALDVGGWRQSDTYPAYLNSYMGMQGPTINSTAQPSDTEDKWDNCEIWVQDSYSHTPHETTFKSSKRPYIVGGLNGIVADYFDFSKDLGPYGALRPEGTYGAKYRHDEALKRGKNAWVFNYTNCSANGLGYHYRGNAKEIHQWIYDNDWIIRDDMFTGVLANDYTDELLTSTIYRTNFAGGAGGWGEPSYTWDSDYNTCTATRSWYGAIGYTETETATVNRTQFEPSCTTPGYIEVTATFTNSAFATQVHTIEGAPDLGHNWIEESTTPATCTVDGQRVYSCDRCDKTKTEVIPMLSHAPGEEQTVEESGCIYHVITCTRPGCGIELSRVLVEDTTTDCSHETTTTSTETVREADCVNPKLIRENVTCTVCGKVISSTIVSDDSGEIAPNKHDWDATEYSWDESTHTVTATRTCKNNASHIETETAPYTSGETVSPWCTTEGSILYSSARLTNEELGNDDGGRITKTETIPALRHNWGTGVITKQHTCAEQGERTFTCARCGETATETLSALGHSWDAAYDWSEDYSTCIATQTCVRDDSHKGNTATGNVTFQMATMPTTTQSGMRTYTATFTPDWAETQIVNQEIDPLHEGSIAYLATTGNSVWTKGTNINLPFTYERTENSGATFNHFKGVQIDGQQISRDGFKAKSGSVIIELLPQYLNTLSVGTHTIQPLFDDGEGEPRDFTVLEGTNASDDENGGSESKTSTTDNTTSNASESAADATSEGATPEENAEPTKPKKVSTSQSALAKTSDAIPAYAVVAASIVAALSLATLLIARRKRTE